MASMIVEEGIARRSLENFREVKRELDSFHISGGRVAVDLGVSRSTMFRYLRGDTVLKPRTARKLARLLAELRAAQGRQ